MTITTDYSTDHVRSADGTIIGYRQLGSGPPIILMHGGMQAAQYLMGLARALAATFTVIVPDRRGRGLSGPHGSAFSVEREVEDVQALVTATGATRIFGLSSGALVTLRTALATPALTKVALYEPPLSIDGSAPTAWLPRFDREIAAGRTASALATAFKGMRTEPAFARIPRFVLVPLLAVGSRLQGEPAEGDVSITALVPTQHYDLQLVGEMADTLADYATLDPEVLLMGGSKSPAFLWVALNALASTLPRTSLVTFDGLGHSGPDDDGDPTRVADTLRVFFN